MGYCRRKRVESAEASIPGASSIPGPLKASSLARCESNRERPGDRKDIKLTEVCPQDCRKSSAGRAERFKLVAWLELDR